MQYSYISKKLLKEIVENYIRQTTKDEIDSVVFETGPVLVREAEDYKTELKGVKVYYKDKN